MTDADARNAKAKNKAYRKFFGDGLYLEVTPSGGKLWRVKYRFGGIEKRLALGAYPVISLKEARAKTQEAKKYLSEGKDPGEVKKAAKAAIRTASENSFEAVAREWYARWKTDKAVSHTSKVIARLENDVFPWIGSVPVSEVSAPMVLSVVRRIEGRGVIETAHRAKENISMVMRYAIATGRAERDPCPDLRGALPPMKKTHMAAITEPVKVGELMRAIDQYAGSHIVRAALALAPLVFVRPGELRAAKWVDIDLDRAEWRYTASKTKTEHLVPLARQAVEILRDLHPLTGRGELVFPGTVSGRSISDATINRALQRMGYNTKTEMTGHGFRAMARTLLAEELHEKPEVIEHQLGHKVPDTLGTAYNRTKFLKERMPMMQAWADYLDRLKKGADVIPLEIRRNLPG
jgi:integrase